MAVRLKFPKWGSLFNPQPNWLLIFCVCHFRLYFHNGYSDPLGWTGQPAFTVHQFCLEKLTHLIKQTSHHKPATLVIDSLSWILRHHSRPDVCKTLQQLKKGDYLLHLCFLYFSWMEGMKTAVPLPLLLDLKVVNCKVHHPTVKMYWLIYSE